MSLTRGRELPIGARAGLIDPKHVKAIGSARWLYDWILWRVTSEQDGLGRVLGGSPVRCEEIAADLGVGLRTVYRWMRRLRGQYIRTRHVVSHGRHGLAIEVLRSKKFSSGMAGSRRVAESRSLALTPGLRRAGAASPGDLRRDWACDDRGKSPSFPQNAREGWGTRGSGNPQISTFSTGSTGNPARNGGMNPAKSARVNPANRGGFYKEDGKPLTESYRKENCGFLEDLTGEGSLRKANPSHLTDAQKENQSKDEKQIPRFARNDSGLERQMPWNDQTESGQRIPRPVEPSGAHRACLARNASSTPNNADGLQDGSAEGDAAGNAPGGHGASPGADEAPVPPEKELLTELRRMIGAKSLPREVTPQRRELLERQRSELLRRAERKYLPP